MNEEQKSNGLVLVNVSDAFLARWNEHLKLATTLIKSGFLPKVYSSPEQVLAVMLKGRELNLPTMEALQNLFPVNGKIGMQGVLMFSLVRRSGQLEAWKIDSKDTYCEVMIKRRGEEPYTTKWTIEDAKRANLLTKDNWKFYPRQMLQWRALADNFRITFSDVFSGMNLVEEISPDIKLDEMGDVEEFFDEPLTYERLKDSLLKICDKRDTVPSDLEQWYDLNKTDIEKLIPKHKDNINRIHNTEFTRRKQKEVKKPEVPNGPIGDSQSIEQKVPVEPSPTGEKVGSGI